MYSGRLALERVVIDVFLARHVYTLVYTWSVDFGTSANALIYKRCAFRSGKQGTLYPLLSVRIQSRGGHLLHHSSTIPVAARRSRYSRLRPVARGVLMRKQQNKQAGRVAQPTFHVALAA